MNSSFPVGPMVVGIDGSRAALDAVRFAMHEARDRHSSLRLVHVISPHPQPETVYGAPDVDGDYGRGVLHEAVLAASEVDHGVMVETAVLHGQPESALLSEAKSSCLLVLGASGSSVLAARILRSLVFSLVESSACPVAIVRESSIGSDGAVVVAVGDAEVVVSDVVVGEAFREASSRNAHLVAIHTVAVSQILAHAFGGSGHDPQVKSLMDIRLEPFGEKYPKVRVSTVRGEAGSGPELVALSSSAQLIVLGHEQGQACGSTLTTVLREARCPVLVVPHA
ncbi:universal stress protein [Rhodococcus sp. G-MC3]|uniref:universal stress protein n=1 Tax=Rhodococcus sp. G-MC3 TaxID=3046209 RepID=UPI0024B8ED27|nr:universal stress protein [Rhodococcus sp. G-MC3]MDJ0394818.1 universal stress protein [Rhodococcus sp. G-MC3]